jgi:uncharacterized protein
MTDAKLMCLSPNLSKVYNKLKPIYSNFDGGHNTTHIDQVIINTYKILKENSYLGLNENLALLVAIYHDIGIVDGRKNHELNSGVIFKKDFKYLNSLLGMSYKDLTIAKEAIEDHRSSKKLVPRSIYGELIRYADGMSEEFNFIRPIKYYQTNNPGMSKDDTFNIIYDYLYDRYNQNDNSGIYFKSNMYDNYIKNRLKIINDRYLSMKLFNRNWSSLLGASDKL